MILRWLRRLIGSAMAGVSVVQPQAGTPTGPTSVVQAGKSEHDIAQAQFKASAEARAMVQHARRSILADIAARKTPPRDWRAWREPTGDGQAWLLERTPPTDEEWDEALRGVS